MLKKRFKIQDRLKNVLNVNTKKVGVMVWISE